MLRASLKSVVTSNSEGKMLNRIGSSTFTELSKMSTELAIAIHRPKSRNQAGSGKISIATTTRRPAPSRRSVCRRIFCNEVIGRSSGLLVLSASLPLF